MELGRLGSAIFLLKEQPIPVEDTVMYTYDDYGPRKLANSKNWFNRGRELLEESRVEDALFCFEEAKRLGHLKSADAILLCKNQLGLT